MSNIVNTLKGEPALVTAGVLALIGVAAAFGLHTSNDQQAAIVALVGAVLALIGGGVTRSKVSPVAARPAQAPLPGATSTANESTPMKFTKFFRGEGGYGDPILLLVVLDTIGIALLLFGISFHH
jgi:ascorbate-specific PTS system EIIC-type component UlaA